MTTDREEMKNLHPLWDWKKEAKKVDERIKIRGGIGGVDASKLGKPQKKKRK